jgi:hypothetical protein
MRRPLAEIGWCDGCRRDAVVWLASTPLPAMVREAYGRMRPGARRRRPYLCSDCLTAFRMESEETVVARRASEEAAATPNTLPEGWS